MCSDKNRKFINIKAKRIENIIRSSRLYRDGVHNELQLRYEADSELYLKAYKGCVEKYLHPKEIKKALKRQHNEEEAHSSVEPSRKRRSEILRFNFSHQCLFCGEE